jgi:hypothetical protein
MTLYRSAKILDRNDYYWRMMSFPPPIFSFPLSPVSTKVSPCKLWLGVWKIACPLQ